MTKKVKLFMLIAAAVIITTGSVRAQSTQRNAYSTVITWHSTSYAPSDFPGKTLATNGSSISLYVMALNNGKVVDVSQDPILWYVDQNFLDGGVGQQQESFKVTQTASGSHFVSVQIQFPDQTVSASENISITPYKAVIDAPYPNDSISGNSTINLSLIPYFFNISSFNDLSFSWNINGTQQTSSNSDNTLTLNVGNQGSGQSVNVSANIQNNANQYEIASSKTNLYVQ